MNNFQRRRLRENLVETCWLKVNESCDVICWAVARACPHRPVIWHDFESGQFVMREWVRVGVIRQFKGDLSGQSDS
jgi:hypothetical protein